MKNLRKFLLPIIVIFIMLIIVIIWAIAKPDDDSDSQPVNQSVVAMSIYDIRSLSVTNSETGSVIGFSSVMTEDGNQVWSLLGSEDDDSLDVDQDKVNSYVSLLCNFMSQDLIMENPSNLEQYGLSPAKFTITITDTSGATTRILIGNKLANGSYAYFMVEGDNKVYTVASIKYTYCEYTQIDFVSSQILDLQFATINSVEFIRTTDNFDATARCIPYADNSGASYRFTSPFITEASTVFGNMVDKVVQLKIARFVELSDAEVVLYGLDNPAYTFVFTMNSGEQVTVQFSDVVENEMYYGRCSTTNQYFMVSNQQVSGFESPVMTLIGEWICYNFISDVSEITGTLDDTTWSLTLDVPNSITDSDATVELDRRNASVTTPDGSRSYAAILFEEVSCIRIGGVEFDADPEYSPDTVEMTLVVRGKNYTSHTYEFVPRGTDSYYVFVDGEYSCFYVNGEELYAYGGLNTHGYGVWMAYILLKTAIDNQFSGTFDLNDFVTSYEAAS